MQIINAKTKKQMIELFINLADSRQTGYLQFNEVVDLSTLTLHRYFQSKDKIFFDSLANYFARFIFEVCDTPLKDELKISRIRELIEEVVFTSLTIESSEFKFSHHVLRGRHIKDQFIKLILAII